MSKIAICGVTGAVGQETLIVLEKMDFPIGELVCFASHKSAGQKIKTAWGEKVIQEFSLEKCHDFDFVFLCVGGDFSAQFGRKLSMQNNYVIDNSSHFRYEDDVPLIVPEVNVDSIGSAKLISNPNCTTAILHMALYPLYQEFGLKKVIVSTYQATSGGGAKAMEELRRETKNYLEQQETKNEIFAHPIPFNLIPAIDAFQENGYTKEEMKVLWESRKIFNDPDLQISVTAVRVPTFRAHAESVTIETKKPIDITRVRKILSIAPGLKLVDDPNKHLYPMPLTVSKKFAVEVGRIRKNIIFGDCGLDFFVCGDQLLKGAALNTVQIALAILRRSNE